MQARIVKTTFLGRYVNYELAFDGVEMVPDQPSIELSQDIGTARQVFKPGDVIRLTVNPEKINLFAENGESLMREASA